jgi:hypothetical protein
MIFQTDIATPSETIEAYKDLQKGVITLGITLLIMCLLFGWILTRDRREDSATKAYAVERK